MRFRLLSTVALAVMTVLAIAVVPPAKPDIFAGTTTMDGLLPVHVDRAGGHILLTLPAAGPDGVMGRYLYSNALRTGLGSAPTFLDRGRVGDTQVLAFRRFGKRVAIVF